MTIQFIVANVLLLIFLVFLFGKVFFADYTSKLIKKKKFNFIDYASLGVLILYIIESYYTFFIK